MSWLVPQKLNLCTLAHEYLAHAYCHDTKKLNPGIFLASSFVLVQDIVQLETIVLKYDSLAV